MSHTVEKIKNHFLYNEIECFKESNQLGYIRMLTTAQEVVKQFDDFKETLKFIVRGQPYAGFNMKYEIQHNTSLLKLGEFEGWVIILTFYPAGFAWRFQDMMKDIDEYVAELRMKLAKCIVEEGE